MIDITKYVKVTAPQRSLSQLDEWIEFYSKKGIHAPVEKIKAGTKYIADAYVLWRRITPAEEKDIEKGKVVIRDNMLVYTK